MTPEKIEHQGTLYAIIIRSDHEASGVEFFTSPEASQQLGLMGHPKGKKILPHVHRPLKRTMEQTQETLFIKKGKLKVDFYDGERSIFHSTVLNALDVILLITGGHGFEVMEDLQMVELKSGPYAGDSDKERFT